MSEQDSLTLPNLRHYLSGIPYPATSQDIITYARNKGGNNGVMHLLQQLPRKEYRNEDDILSHLSLDE